MRHLSRRKRPSWPETSIIAVYDNGLEMGRNQTEAHEGLLDLVEEVDRSRMAPEPLHLVAGNAPSSRSKAATTANTICSTVPLCCPLSLSLAASLSPTSLSLGFSPSHLWLAATNHRRSATIADPLVKPVEGA